MFSFALSKEQKMVKDEVSKLVKSMLVDTAHDMDEQRAIPPEGFPWFLNRTGGSA